MILGYVDSEDRIYDLNFATLRLRVEAGEKGTRPCVMFSQVAGGGAESDRILAEADGIAEVWMDHDGHRVPLQREVDGHLCRRQEAGLLFFASPPRRNPDNPGYFLVKLRALPSAVKFFFEDREGREIVSIPRDEVPDPENERRGFAVCLSAANVALPKEKIVYAMYLQAASRIGPFLEDFASSSKLRRFRVC